MELAESIETIIKGEDELFIEVIRGDVDSDQRTDNIEIIDGEDYLKIIADDTGYAVTKSQINKWYKTDDTLTMEFSPYEKVVIRVLDEE